MRITLTYKGEIPGNKRPPEKIDAIRQEFHRQLTKLWGRNQLSFLKDWVDTGFAGGAPDFRRRHGKRTYLPIVSEAIYLRARLNVRLLSGLDQHQPSYAKGDIDNRVKSLLDALSAPTQASRIPAAAPFRDTICFMSDDSLVDELTVSTAPLLAVGNPGVTLAIVDADIIAGDRVLTKTLASLCDAVIPYAIGDFWAASRLHGPGPDAAM